MNDDIRILTAALEHLKDAIRASANIMQDHERRLRRIEHPEVFLSSEDEEFLTEWLRNAEASHAEEWDGVERRRRNAPCDIVGMYNVNESTCRVDRRGVNPRFPVSR